MPSEAESNDRLIMEFNLDFKFLAEIKKPANSDCELRPHFDFVLHDILITPFTFDNYLFRRNHLSPVAARNSFTKSRYVCFGTHNSDKTNVPANT